MPVIVSIQQLGHQEWANLRRIYLPRRQPCSKPCLRKYGLRPRRFGADTSELTLRCAIATVTTFTTSNGVILVDMAHENRCNLHRQGKDFLITIATTQTRAIFTKSRSTWALRKAEERRAVQSEALFRLFWLIIVSATIVSGKRTVMIHADSRRTVCPFHTHEFVA